MKTTLVLAGLVAASHAQPLPTLRDRLLKAVGTICLTATLIFTSACDRIDFPTPGPRQEHLAPSQQVEESEMPHFVRVGPDWLESLNRQRRRGPVAFVAGAAGDKVEVIMEKDGEPPQVLDIVDDAGYDMEGYEFARYMREREMQVYGRVETRLPQPMDTFQPVELAGNVTFRVTHAGETMEGESKEFGPWKHWTYAELLQVSKKGQPPVVSVSRGNLETALEGIRNGGKGAVLASGVNEKVGYNDRIVAIAIVRLIPFGITPNGDPIVQREAGVQVIRVIPGTVEQVSEKIAAALPSANKLESVEEEKKAFEALGKYLDASIKFEGKFAVEALALNQRQFEDYIKGRRAGEKLPEGGTLIRSPVNIELPNVKAPLLGGQVALNE